MVRADGQPALGEPHPELEETAGVPAHHHLGTGLGDPVELPPEQLARDLGLEQVVDAGRAAAEVGVAELHEPEPRDGAQQRPRRLAHALAVGEVAGLVVRHRERQRVPRLGEGGGEQFRDVPRARGERGGRRVGREQVPVVAERRPATGGPQSYIGKETNRLEEREAGLVSRFDTVMTITDPCDDPWRIIIIPTLRMVPAKTIAQRSKLDRTTIKRLLSGDTDPIAPWLRFRLPWRAGAPCARGTIRECYGKL